jgi:hypothetical protein
MPRGVYDRSLTKEQRAATKEGKTPKRKYTKRAAVAAAPKRKYTRRVDASQVKAFSKSANPDSTFVMMGEVRSNLVTLSQLRTTFGDLPSLSQEADAQISVLGQLRDKLFNEQVEVADTSNEVSSETEHTDDGEETQPQNGTIQVPLPPPPPVVPILPTH